MSEQLKAYLENEFINVPKAELERLWKENKKLREMLEALENLYSYARKFVPEEPMGETGIA